MGVHRVQGLGGPHESRPVFVGPGLALPRIQTGQEIAERDLQRDGLVRAPVVQPDRKHGLDEQPQGQRRGWAPAPMRVVLAQPKQG